MLRRRRTRILIHSELDDRALARTLVEVRPGPQMHGLAADGSRAPWHAVARLLRETGRNWDRRGHRMRVLARELPPSVADRWTAQQPDDADALVLRAYGRALRCEPSADRDCLRAAEACPQDPTPWVALLSLQRRLGAPERAGVLAWREVVRRDPWNRTAYHQLLLHLSPRERGSLVAMIDFARHGAARAPAGSPLTLLPLAARVEHYGFRLLRGGTNAVGVNQHWFEPGAAEDIDAALAGWFHYGTPAHAEAVADLSLLAFALCRAHRTDDAKPVFQRLGRHMTAYPWDLLKDPVGTFVYWRDQCG